MPGTLDLSVIAKLTNLNDINRALHDVLARERLIDAELDQQLSQQQALETQILQLQASTSEVS